MVIKMNMMVRSVMLIARPIVKLKKPKFTSVAVKPTLSALKKRFLTGPFGKSPLSRYDRAEPMIPPAIIPVII
jgi:hypothetical protein